ncbi:DNA mismatch repair protein [Scheffersomyces spartinae]|uniref:DNA mismatch repair protein n=1 Tax=Scheffersomyces spartinae TaxID=45513 RepID=A0A9P7VDB7_9ASCO|nr:DNA mismatch repair protein [Scheffersomyces spartinae]KAG7195712.1 DNA mismatch repair protein [Scheffersomyces spartinae]
MTSIARLDSSEWTRIQSGVVAPDFATGVKGIFMNSLEGGATNIDLRVDFSSLSLFCKDNGEGITKARLEHISKQSMNRRTGNLIRSLSTMSRLTIISHVEGVPTTYITEGLLLVKPYIEHHLYNDGVFNIGEDSLVSTHGTVTIVSNLFYNVPVRRTQLLLIPRYKLENQLREVILEALMEATNYTTGVSLNVSVVSSLGKELVPLLQSDLSLSRFSFEDLLHDIFGFSRAFMNFDCDDKDDSMSVRGVVSRFFVQTTRYQYIFINNSRVKIPRSISRTLNRVFESVSFENDPTSLNSPIKGGQGVQKASWRPYLKYPVIMVKCSTKSNTIPSLDQLDKIFKVICESMRELISVHGVPTIESPRKPTIRGNKVCPNKRMITIVSPPISDPCLELRYSSCNKRTIDLMNRTSLYQIPKHGFKNYDLRVVRQIDNKFIMLSMGLDRVSDRKHVPVLMLLDQHACDERIRVEELFKEFIESIIDTNVTLGTRLDKIVEFDVVASQVGMFECFKHNFIKFGIQYEINHKRILVTHLPRIISTRDSTFIERSMLQHCYDLDMHSKQVNFDFNKSDWFHGIPHLPQVFVDTINSKACRSSIMFGDALDKQEIEHLVLSLTRCQLPFQCAHGRPSIIPLLELSNSDITGTYATD